MKLLYTLLSILALTACTNSQLPPNQSTIPVSDLSGNLQVGDVVFIRATSLPFRKIAHDTGSWTNHVGIIVGEADGEYQVGESTFPWSRISTLSHFISRSENNRFVISRPDTPLTDEQRAAIKQAAVSRLGIFYDTGFDLHSSRQFCSRYVSEVLKEATGKTYGNTTTLSKLFKENPDADMLFWRVWYFGFIPWKRETITPASLLNSPHLKPVFDGYLEMHKEK